MPTKLPSQFAENNLTCPICMNIPRQKVFQCPNGHLICEPCKIDYTRNSTTCPTCRAPLGNNRNLLAEKLIDITGIPCKFQIEGCRMILKKEVLENHEMKCQFRLVYCSTCRQEVSLSKMVNHIQEHQKNDFRKYDGPNYKCSFFIKDEYFQRRTSWIRGFIQFCDEEQDLHFIQELSRTSRGNWYFWINALEENEMANKYTASIKLTTESGEQEFAFSNCEINRLNNKAQIPENMQAMPFNDNIAKKFRSNDRLTFEVQIQKTM